MKDIKCNCILCNDLNLDDPRDTVEKQLEYLSTFISFNSEKDHQDIRDSLFSLFNVGYILGFKSAIVERMENDLEALKYMMNDKQ